MKIYTRGGDDGTTALFGGGRVKKHHDRVGAYGAVDEANATVGLVAAAGDVPDGLVPRLHGLMSDLFDLGAELATPDDEGQSKLQSRMDSAIGPERIAALEAWIDDEESRLPPLTTFVLPTGTDAAARLHLARTQVRRAEREVVALVEGGTSVRGDVLAYLNRLSDLLFVLARVCNAAADGDALWQAKKARSEEKQ